MVDSVTPRVNKRRPTRCRVVSVLLGVAVAMTVAVATAPVATVRAQVPSRIAEASTVDAAAARDGSHDFDFLVGTWSTKNRRLLHPLSGDNTWETFESRMTVQQLPGRFGNVDLFEPVQWRPGFLGMGLRLYNPATHKWSSYWLTNRNAGMVGETGRLDTPVVGGFHDGVGTMESRETWEGRPIRVRFVWYDITARSARWRQEFSADDGKTWEVNWIAEHTRDGA